MATRVKATEYWPKKKSLHSVLKAVALDLLSNAENDTLKLFRILNSKNINRNLMKSIFTIQSALD